MLHYLTGRNLTAFEPFKRFLFLVALLLIADYLIIIFLEISWYYVILDLLLEAPRILLFAFFLLFIWEKLRQQTARAIFFKKKFYQQRKAYFTKKSQFQDFKSTAYTNWGFTKSESEVADYLLIGLSSKEIAKKRFTSERTVRNHCQSIYEKSQLKGRQELCAHFLKPLI